MNILDTIYAQRKIRVTARKKEVSLSSLARSARAPVPYFRDSTMVTLIAECKKGSPSRGIFIDDYNPVTLAHHYREGGADALSILTEPDFFFGSDEHLTAVRSVVDLPILRKDFVFDPYQVTEAWALGADAILLIAAMLSDQQINELAACARSLDLSILLETHDRGELERAASHEVSAVGINARNLKDFSIDLDGLTHLRSLISPSTVAVAESGLKSCADGQKMYRAGFRGFLVGEYFATAPSPESTIRAFKAALGE